MPHEQFWLLQSLTFLTLKGSIYVFVKMKHGVSHDLVRSAGLPDRFPTTSEEADLVDEVLAKELEKLSVQEHEQILFDIVGINPKVEEDLEMLQSKLEEMEGLLESMPDNMAYLESKSLNGAYTANYRLAYLRGEHYDASAAAKKLNQRMMLQKEYFGILGREIRWTDLTEGAQKVVQAAYLVASQVRDSSGRAVIFSSAYYEQVVTPSYLDMVGNELYIVEELDAALPFNDYTQLLHLLPGTSYLLLHELGIER